jgi:hypothetical protein
LADEKSSARAFVRVSEKGEVKCEKKVRGWGKVSRANEVGAKK